MRSDRVSRPFRNTQALNGLMHGPGTAHVDGQLVHHLARAAQRTHRRSAPDAFEILGCRMNHDVGRRKSTGALQHRRTEAVVHCQTGTSGMGHLGQRLDVGDLVVSGLVGVSRYQQARGRRDQSGPVLGGETVGPAYLDPEARQEALEQVHGAAEHVARGDHMITGLQQAEDHRCGGRHAGCGSRCTLRCPPSRPGAARTPAPSDW